MSPRNRAPDLGIDTGGTFTDFVARDGRILKLASQSAAPGEVLAEGVSHLVPELDSPEIVHGTTVATNALLTGKLAQVGIITTRGFGDVLSVGRQARANLYDLSPRTSHPLPDPRWIIEVEERLSAQGKVLCPMDEEACLEAGRKLKARGAESLCILFLHSWVNPRHEKRAERLLRPLGLTLTTSSKLVAEFREFERFSTAWANAALTPRLESYIKDLKRRLPKKARLAILRSDGGRCRDVEAQREPVQLVLSGPAGGVVGAWGAASTQARRKLLTLDMGGTSTDVALLDGREPLVRRTLIAGRPLLVPVMDVHTVGAGGGSIASVDKGGALCVGPASAGAYPGPAAYGHGGPPTVTDAQIILGRILPERVLGGDFKIDPTASRLAIQTLAKSMSVSVDRCALGILAIAEVAMARALRAISLERGHDPREFSIVAFGGAGALHAASLAESIGIQDVVVPLDSGVLSAKGMLFTRWRREYSKTMLGLGLSEFQEHCDRCYAPLEKRLKQALVREGADSSELKWRRSVSLRYCGQSHELDVPLGKVSQLAEDFAREHERRFGFRQPDAPVELVALRVEVEGPRPRFPHRRVKGRTRLKPFANRRVVMAQSQGEVPFFDREDLPIDKFIKGPAIVCEYSATTLVPPQWDFCREQRGNLVLKRRK